MEKRGKKKRRSERQREKPLSDLPPPQAQNARDRHQFEEEKKRTRGSNYSKLRSGRVGKKRKKKGRGRSAEALFLRFAPGTCNYPTEKKIWEKIARYPVIEPEFDAP